MMIVNRIDLAMRFTAQLKYTKEKKDRGVLGRGYKTLLKTGLGRQDKFYFDLTKLFAKYIFD